MMKRRRFEQTQSLRDRLANYAAKLRGQAQSPSSAIGRERLVRIALRAETASHINDWQGSTGLRSPKEVATQRTAASVRFSPKYQMDPTQQLTNACGRSVAVIDRADENMGRAKRRRYPSRLTMAAAATHWLADNMDMKINPQNPSKGIIWTG